MNFRNVTIILSSIILLGMIGFVGSKTTRGGIDFIIGMAFFLPFYGLPPIVSMVLSVISKNPFSQGLLATTSLLYGIWFTYAMYLAFYVDLDPQSGLVILFVGIYALPVLLPLWIVTLVLNAYYTKKSASVLGTARGTG